MQWDGKKAETEQVLLQPCPLHRAEDHKLPPLTLHQIYCPYTLGLAVTVTIPTGKTVHYSEMLDNVLLYRLQHPALGLVPDFNK